MVTAPHFFDARQKTRLVSEKPLPYLPRISTLIWFDPPSKASPLIYFSYIIYTIVHPDIADRAPARAIHRHPSHDGTLPCTRASFRELDCAATCPLHPCKLWVCCRGWLGRGCARLEPLQLHQMVRAACQAPDAREQLRRVDRCADPARPLQLQHSSSRSPAGWAVDQECAG